MEYYVQRHASGYLGNAPVWWCKGGKGYSAYLENAERFNQADAEKLCKESPEKYRMYPCDFIDERTHTVFDMQTFRELEQWNINQSPAEALANRGE
jgi:hypothetical protein